LDHGQGSGVVADRQAGRKHPNQAIRPVRARGGRREQEGLMGTKKMPSPIYKRILLKLSGEALMGAAGFGIDAEVVTRIAEEIKEVHGLGVDIAVVIGGGNIFRGLSARAQKMDRVAADHMGMLATVINSLALQDSLEQASVVTRVMSAIEMRAMAEP